MTWVLSAGLFDGPSPNRIVIIPICTGDVIIRICEICYLLTGTFPHQSCYHTCRSCMLSAWICKVCFFLTEASLTPALLSFPVTGTMLSAGFVSEHLFDGLCTYTRVVSMPGIVISGFWCSRFFLTVPGSPEQVQIYLPKLIFLACSFFNRCDVFYYLEIGRAHV